MYNAWLSFKYRPRLTVWGKLVAWWLVVSSPWFIALVWYTLTGVLAEQVWPIVCFSAFMSAVVALVGAFSYDANCDEWPKWHIFRKNDE